MQLNPRAAFYLIGFILLWACNPFRVAGQSRQVASKNRLSVKFISMGAGIDVKAEQNFSDYLNKFQKAKNTPLDYKIKPWGKEGETEYIFNLEKLSSKHKEDLKKTITEMFRDNKLVKVVSG